MPQAMSRIINEELNKHMKQTGEACHVFIDGGNCIGWALHYMHVDPPMQMHNSLDMGPMGFGSAAVVGGQFGDPKATCICLTGDGGFMMQGNEVSTAAQYKQGVIWIVEFNNDLGMVSQGNAHFYPKPKKPSWDDYYALGNPDLCRHAEGLGAEAYRATSQAQLQRQLKAALKGSLKGKPQVIVVDIDRVEVPPYYQADPTQPATKK